MGTTAIISGVLALLSMIGGMTGKALSNKNARENVNAMAEQDDSGKGVSIASDVTGLASQMLSFADGLPSSDRLFNKSMKASHDRLTNQFNLLGLGKKGLAKPSM